MIRTDSNADTVRHPSVAASRSCLPRWLVRLCDAAADDPATAWALIVLVAWAAAGFLL